ncbi:MAG: lyase family protein [Lentimicrobium sp.]|jgi:aspartate ammonia-lyase|nr:lyase family protein [Lentimicrobium sp.]
MEFREESDFLGKESIPADAFYGIHAFRARANFPDRTPFHEEWYRAMGLVKQACYLTADSFFAAIRQKYAAGSIPVKTISPEVMAALEEAAAEVAQGNHFDQFIVPAVNGGAGTSINMNVNEIMANAALLKLGFNPGDYGKIDPTEEANVFQSTNDVVPTALKVAVMFLLQELEAAINELRGGFETLEGRYRDNLRVAYTQMQEAVPSSFGKLFSNYSDALSRDWWRVSKCFERIKVVNLGGSAVGTSVAVPRFFVMEVVQQLQQLTNLPLTRGENLTDTTSNFDAFVEVHAILKSHAVNLEKIANDLRLLASDLVKDGGIKLPQKQVGSSIMPGKVNPVIPEFIISASQQVYANDGLISGLCAQGCLDLNAYLPLIGHSLIGSLKLLIASCRTMLENMVKGLEVDTQSSYRTLMHSPAITTALSPFIGYHRASEVAKKMKASGKSIFQINDELNLLPNEKLNELLKPANLLKAGYSVNDL